MENEVIGTVQSGAMFDLGECLSQVQASKKWFAQRILPLSLEQLRWRPRREKWSVCQCLAHLNLGLELWLPSLDSAIAGRSTHSRILPGQHRIDSREIKALKVVEPPVVIPSLAMPALIPPAAVDADHLVNYFYRLRDRYASVIRSALHLDVGTIRLAEPIAPPIRSLGATIAYLAAHERRHIWQVEQLFKTPAFPRGPS